MGKYEIMNYKNISDLHTHCEFSFDSSESPCKMLKRAEELNLKYYALTKQVIHTKTYACYKM